MRVDTEDFFGHYIERIKLLEIVKVMMMKKSIVFFLLFAACTLPQQESSLQYEENPDMGQEVPAYLAGGEANHDVSVKTTIQVFVDNRIQDNHMEQLLKATDYLSALLGHEDMFEIKLVDWSVDYHELKYWNRAVFIHPTFEGSLGHAAWWGSYEHNSWNGRISYRPDEPLSDIYFGITFLHEFGHVFGLTHVDDTHNVMNDFVSSLDFTDEQLEIIEENVFGHLDNLPK